MVDRFVAGCILLSLTIPGLMCSAIIMKIIICSKQLRNIIAYRIILQISMIEFVLLLGHVISSTMPLTDSTYGYWGKKILSTVLQSFYICVLLLNAVLAFNRFFINTSFGANSTGKIYTVIIGFCYLILAAEIACYLSPYVATDFSLDTFDWVFDNTLQNPLMTYIVHQEQIIAFGGMAFELACYVAIFVMITKKRISPSSTLSTHSSHNPEYRILVTSVVAFTYQVIMIIPFHFGERMFPGAKWVHLLNAATWAFFPTLQQISIVSLNREFRRRSLLMIFGKKQYAQAVSTVSANRRKSQLVREYFFDESQKKQLLESHNTLRSLEPASNMQELVWDDRLAKTALAHARNCDVWHSKPETRLHKFYDWIGENIWWSNDKTLRKNLRSAMLEFYDEKKFYFFGQNVCAKGKMCLHYTQFVWATTCAVGCAATQCSSIKHGRHISHGHVIVCHYGEGVYVHVTAFTFPAQICIYDNRFAASDNHRNITPTRNIASV
ncbi:hypothetical protein QR680_018024 [Steinernema hermaphroditum]|uniref:SCP domain-containing protein n=1 Tax=Steinernema hermaphroditum TaxID=289476 RepID=A0AA39HHL8_9BILA|nr:hypothetical protein QR680_018024 [Steinernema hermaphroditum]